MTRIGDFLTASTYRVGALTAQAMPGVVAAGMASPLAFGANVASPQRRAMIERHLRRVDPSLGGVRLRRGVQQAFDSYAKYWLESFRLPNLSRRAVAAGFSEEGYEEHIVEGLRAGNGVIIALPHLGGWEWAGR